MFQFPAHFLLQCCSNYFQGWIQSAMPVLEFLGWPCSIWPNRDFWRFSTSIAIEKTKSLLSLMKYLFENEQPHTTFQKNLSHKYKYKEKKITIHLWWMINPKRTALTDISADSSILIAIEKTCLLSSMM